MEEDAPQGQTVAEKIVQIQVEGGRAFELTLDEAVKVYEMLRPIVDAVRTAGLQVVTVEPENEPTRYEDTHEIIIDAGNNARLRRAPKPTNTRVYVKPDASHGYLVYAPATDGRQVCVAELRADHALSLWCQPEQITLRVSPAQ